MTRVLKSGSAPTIQAQIRQTLRDLDLFERGVQHVGWGGKVATTSGDLWHLGVGARRPGEPGWFFHFCYGYVNGFKVRDIFYYLLTRHTFKWAWHRAYVREGGEWLCDPGCVRCERRLGQ